MGHLAERRTTSDTGWDRGRKLLSVTKLSAGGALIASNLVSLLGSVTGRVTSSSVDMLAASVGGVATFAILASAFHIFEPRR